MCAYRYGPLPVCTNHPNQLRVITVAYVELLRRKNNSDAWRTPNGQSYGRMSITDALRLAKRLTR